MDDGHFDEVQGIMKHVQGSKRETLLPVPTCTRLALEAGDSRGKIEDEALAVRDVWQVFTYLVSSYGAEPLNARPGCFEFFAVPSWRAAVNPHETLNQSCIDNDGAHWVDPFAMRVCFQGFLAGVLTPASGWFVGGYIANVHSFTVAMAQQIYYRNLAFSGAMLTPDKVEDVLGIMRRATLRHDKLLRTATTGW